MIIGSHVSTQGGILNALTKAQELDISAIQIFASAPNNWYPPKTTIAQAQQYGQTFRTHHIDYIFFHSIYLINLASANPELITKSKQSLISYLNLNAAIGGNGVIFHIGSSKERSFDDVLPQVTDNINDILAESDPKSMLIIETNAGSGNSIGKTFEQIKTIIDGIKDKSRLGVCIDTAHIFASGYDLVSAGAKNILNQFDQTIGLSYLKAFHFNDSKVAYNSHVDRHANIGQGYLGDKVFRQLLHLKELAKIPCLLEVPGYENRGPDKINVDKLKELAK